MKLAILRWCFTAGCVLAALPALARTAAEVPAEAFYREPDLAQAVLSPSGRHLAAIVGTPGRRPALGVIDLDKAAPAQPLARFADADIDQVQWVNDDWLVFSLADRLRGGGATAFAPGLFAVRRDGSELRLLIEPSVSLVSDSRAGRRPLGPEHRLLHVPAGGGTEVVVGRAQWNLRGEFLGVQPLRLDIVTGRTRALATDAPEGVQDWLFDAEGEPRVAMRGGDGRRQLHWRAPGSTSWRLLFDEPTFEVPFNVRFLDGPSRLVVSTSSGAGGTSELRRLNLETARPEAEALVRTPGFDFQGQPVQEAAGGRLLGMRIVTDAESTVWFDARLRQLQEAADKRLPGHVNRLSCRRCTSDDPVVLVYSYSDTDPGRYAVHRPADGRWQDLASVRGDVDPRLMATLDLHRVKARDGLELPVWVTTPRGARPGTPQPAVVLVHGGPWVRGVHWRWHDDAQFLASRGYVVIEPEFRGSTGYGQRHFRAGWKQWGLAMQDDLIDALTWAAGKGLVDPKRVCIAGASYGGYAAMMALVRDPGVFRCGVSWVGVTDPRLMFEWSARSGISDEARQHSYKTLIGDPVADAAMLERANPLLRAAEIKAPVLLAYGGRDQRVLPEHGTRMRSALQAAGNEPEWVMYPDEGHGWNTRETRIDFAGRLERFLARHLGAP